MVEKDEVITLVYVSSAIQPFTEPELVELLGKARKNNAQLDVTGLLLYEDGNFMQALEGPESAVRSLFGRIDADPRHRNASIILREEITQRFFADWAMAFRNLLDPAVRSLPGYSEFLRQPLGDPGWRQDPSRARRLLQIFRNGLRH